MRVPLLILAMLLTAVAAQGAGRELIDEHWRFHQGEAPDAESPDLDDSGWQSVDLPHDWSRVAPPRADAPSEGHGGYHETGIGWYRRTLEVKPRDGRQYLLEFGGVYQNATVWLNGQKLGQHYYGYTPFSFDLTPHLSDEGENILAVRVDNSDQPNCRWYSGSGIYRHVWLRELPPVHIVPRSVWVEHPDHASGQTIIHYSVRNATDEEQQVVVTASGDAPSAEPASGYTEQLELTLAPDETHTTPIKVRSESAPWSADRPSLWRLNLRVADSQQRTLDTATQQYGQRSIAVDAEGGLRINGAPVALYGGCVHHDNGPLGAMAFDTAEQRRVRLLKQAGFNAVRTSHNPPSEAFLDACDRQGLYVIDECFDNWAKQKVAKDYGSRFEAIWPQAIKAMIDRDRRHPCVIMWSTGNEVYERGEQSGVTLSNKLAERVRKLDPTRPATIGLCGLWDGQAWPLLDPVFAPLEVVGYNYEIDRYGPDHQRKPQRVIYASESYPVDAFKSWRAVESQSWVIGDFVWTAMDYLGEAAIGRVFPPGEPPRPHWEGSHFPWRGAVCGDIDLTGHRKPISYYRSIVWGVESEQPLYAAVVVPVDGEWGITKWATEPMAAHWNWEVPAGAPLRVRVFSRESPVKLYLNDKLVGERPTTQEQEFQAEFSVPYQPGELKAVDAQGRTYTLRTAGDAARLLLDAESAAAPAGRQSLIYLNAQVADEHGVRQPVQDRTVRFSVSGPGELIAVGNADMTARQSYAGETFDTHEGRVQAILRGTSEPGEVTVTATADGMAPVTTTVAFTDQKQ